MLLAHIFAKSRAPITIAHFNHNLRPDSHLDQKLVQDFALTHRVKFISQSANLPNDSEETARKARHDFLANLVLKNFRRPRPRTRRDSPVTTGGGDVVSEELVCGKVATGHHLDDLVESVAINLIRGTGWRGLAVLNRENYVRPLLELEKSEILALARELGIKWREDSTNQSPKYLRNRLRPKTSALPFDTKWKLLQLRNRQLEITREIEATFAELASKGVSEGGSPRVKRVRPVATGSDDAVPEGLAMQKSLYKVLDSDILLELLYFWLKSQGVKSTMPERKRLLHAIRTFKPQKKFQLTNNRFILIRKDDFLLL